MITFDPAPLRAQFPALSLEIAGRPAVYFDSPGGTQVPQRVIDAVSRYYREQNANTGGGFVTSDRTDEVIAGARAAMADLLNAPDTATIVFGANMTSLTFHLARSFAETIRPGDEIIVTDLDHDANVTPWTDLAALGVVIRTVPIHREDCTLDEEAFRAALSPRTRLAAFTHASNAVGTVLDAAKLTRWAHEAGALVFVDAVQYAPHAPIDVQALDCDFLACSAYKFFGPHVGVLHGKADLLRELRPHKVRPASDAVPSRWETGTQNHEGLAGTSASVDYLADIAAACGEELPQSRRARLRTAMTAVHAYEQTLSKHLLAGLKRIPGIRIYGITDESRLAERLPTVAFTWPRMSPKETAAWLARQGIFCWSGNYYALRLMESLGLQPTGGALRIGLTHLDTVEEIDRLLIALTNVPR